MEKRSKYTYCLIIGIAILIMLSLTGCIPNHFTKKEADAQVKEAKKIMQEYIQQNLPGAKIEYAEVNTEIGKEIGYELTDFVKGTFVYENNEYLFYVNTQNNKIYTSLILEDVAKEISKQIINVNKFKIALNCSSFSIRQLVVAREKDGDEILQCNYVILDNVFEVNASLNDVLKEMQASDKYKFTSISLCYVGEESLENIEKHIKVKNLQQFGQIDFRHLSEQEDLQYAKVIKEKGKLFEVEDYMCSEILDYDFEENLESFERWECNEETPFHIVYRTYLKTNPIDEPTDQTITEWNLGDNVIIHYEDDLLEIQTEEEELRICILADEEVKKLKSEITKEELDSQYARYCISQKWYETGDKYILYSTNGYRIDDWMKIYFNGKAQIRLAEYENEQKKR